MELYNRQYTIMKKIKNETREKYYEDQLEEWDLIKGNKSAAAAAVGWCDGRENQIKRFQALLDIGVQRNDSVIDLGCGLGHMVEYFEKIGLKAREKRVFVDLKFFDVPETVARAIRRLNGRGITFATVHGNDAMMRAAGSASDDLGVLAVTVLTSIDRGDLDDLGFNCDVQELVISRAKRAFEAGCDGIVSSGIEVPYIRKYVDNKLIAVTPGIRPVANDDDQKRVVDVATAFKSGSDYIVVGRPIKNAENRYQAASEIQKIIRSVFESV